MTPREELDHIREQIEALEEQREAVYKRSFNAPADEKVCEDDIAEFLMDRGDRSEMYPITVHDITWQDSERVLTSSHRAGSFVSIRPCAEECSGKTYLGVYLGDLPLSAGISFHKETGVLTISRSMYNPAIWVPDLKRIVFGCESWWGAIKSPNDLKNITDADINGIWYVQAAKAVGVSPVPLDAPAGGSVE